VAPCSAIKVIKATKARIQKNSQRNVQQQRNAEQQRNASGPWSRFRNPVFRPEPGGCALPGEPTPVRQEKPPAAGVATAYLLWFADVEERVDLCKE
jgi:hypothetical protein